MLPLCAIALLLLAQGAGPKDLYSRAVELEAQGNHAAALPLLWDAAGQAPGDADIQHRLGEALERIGALDAAVEAYDRALTARPSFRKTSNNLVRTLVAAGRGREAVDFARRMVASSPSDPEAQFTLGLAQSEQDVDAAIASFSRALELAPRHTLARYNLALVLKRADRVTEAIEHLNRALAIEPRPEAHYTLGVIYWQQGELDRAASALHAALAAEPRYADAHYTLGAVLKARRDWAAAASALRRAIDLKPELWGAHYTLGQVLQQAGDAQGARRGLEHAERLRVRAQKEQEAGVWTAVGSRTLEAGDPGAALESFRRATEICEPYAPAHYQMGRALERLGRRDESRKAFARAHQLNPSLVPPRPLQ